MSRVGIVGMWHETNTYSAKPTTVDDFVAYELLEGAAIVDRHEGTRSVIGGFLQIAGCELVPVFSAGAWPGGTVSAEAASLLLDTLGEDLTDAGSLDGVLVNLHGAMVADGHPDMESDTVGVIREVVGDIPVVCVLDFHANPSVAFLEGADVVIGYDTYPHVDMFERGAEAGDFMGRMLDTEDLCTRIGKHPLLTTPLAQWTDSEPMAGLFSRARHAAKGLGVDRVCITGGFAYADVDRAGISVLATTGVGNIDGADSLVAGVLSDIDEVADRFRLVRPNAAEAVARALAGSETPVVLADVGDNIGGGSAGDGAVLLRELLAQGATGVVSVIADANIAAEAHRVGVGGIVAGPVGGKTDRFHGPSVDITGRVVALSDGRYQSMGSWGTGQWFSMGPTARLSVEGVDLVVTSASTPPFHIEQVTHLGIDPSSVRIITAKGAVAWRSAFGELARTVIEVDTPGVCPVDITTLPRTTQPTRYP